MTFELSEIGIAENKRIWVSWGSKEKNILLTDATGNTFLRKVDTAKTSIAENISDNVSFLNCENLNNSSPKEKKTL